MQRHAHSDHSRSENDDVCAAAHPAHLQLCGICNQSMIGAWRDRLDRSTSPEMASPLSAWIKPQLTPLVTEAPNGDEWAHELEFDGYRMHARLAAMSVC
jgi:ATP-dependent DNA ligase